jgi:peptidoglycan/xylan/chitin deacetylase (PgdA/CDA1 family)
VLLFHDIAPAERADFAAHIAMLSREWRFIPPDRFVAMLAGQEPVVGRNLLITFDDGFASHRWVAESVLNPLGIRGLFFIPTDFIDLQEASAYRPFIANHIFKGELKPEEVPRHLVPLGWSDLSALLEMGHLLGSHTCSHASLSQLANPSELTHELHASGDKLEKILGTRIEHFAYPFGTIDHINATALTIARQRYRFVHSAIRGENSLATPPWAIRRDNLHPNDPQAFMGAVLEGVLDWYYSSRRRSLGGMGKKF